MAGKRAEKQGTPTFIEVPVPLRHKPKLLRLRLSPNSKAIFQKCRQLYRFVYIDKLGDQYRKPRPYFTMANHVHDTLRDFLSLVPVELRTVETIEGMLRRNWRRYCVGFRGKEDERRWAEKALAQVRAFASNQDVSVTPYMVETSLETQITPGLVFRGRLDRVDRQPDSSLHIIDYKTGNVPHETDWTQLREYALLLSRQSRYPVRRLSYHYLSTGVTESADIGEDDLRRVQWELLATAGEVIREKRFRPRPGPWCGGCDFIPICPKGAALEPRADAEGQLELWRDFWAEVTD